MPGNQTASAIGEERAGSDSSTDWVGLLSIVLLSVTAILTAWTGFQASKWGGAMSISFTQAGAARLEAAALASEADRQRSLQIGVFGQWLVAGSQDSEEGADALVSRFREPLKSAFPAWLATKPLQNPDSPESPFDMPEYNSPVLEASKEANARADALFAEGLDNNQRGDNYTILAVLGAVVLFFTAMSTRVKQRLYQWILLGTALILFAGIVTLLVFYPKLL